MIKGVSCAFCGRICISEEECYKHIKDQRHDGIKLDIEEL